MLLISSDTGVYHIGMKVESDLCVVVNRAATILLYQLFLPASRMTQT